MRQQLIDLYEIQKIDLGIKELEDSRDSQPAKLRELEAKIAEIRETLGPLEEEVATADEELKVLKSNVRNEEDKLRKWEKRLADIRNQREYLALSREIEGGKRANQETEGRIQELIQSRDATIAKMEALKDELAEHEIDADSERDGYKAHRQELESKVKAEETRRQSLVGSVKGSLLRKYDSIRKKRMGIGLIAAHAGSCCGCNMKLPPQLFNILQRVDSLEQCPSCQRILVFQGVLDEHDTASGAGVAAGAESGSEASANP